MVLLAVAPEERQGGQQEEGREEEDAVHVGERQEGVRVRLVRKQLATQGRYMNIAMAMILSSVIALLSQYITPRVVNLVVNFICIASFPWHVNGVVSGNCLVR